VRPCPCAFSIFLHFLDSLIDFARIRIGQSPLATSGRCAFIRVGTIGMIKSLKLSLSLSLSLKILLSLPRCSRALLARFIHGATYISRLAYYIPRRDYFNCHTATIRIAILFNEALSRQQCSAQLLMIMTKPIFFRFQSTQPFYRPASSERRAHCNYSARASFLRPDDHRWNN